jgi:hypothetical protein
MNNERFYESKRALPSMMPKPSINADVDAWLAQGGQIKTVKPVGSVEGELLPPNTAAARVLEMLRADALTVKREGANLSISNNQIAAGVHWLRSHGWRIKTVVGGGGRSEGVAA